MNSDDSYRVIGKIISVSADRLAVELLRRTDNFTIVGFDDMHYVARLGSFVLIPVQSDYVIAEITNLHEKDPTTTRIDATSGAELDKAASAKFLTLTPQGMLSGDSFSFGVSIFPSLYADVLYATKEDLDKVFETQEVEGKKNQTKYNALTIGQSVVFEGYDVKVKVDEFFGGHSAILGNTGSGKSCTVATILQSLFSKSDDYKAQGATFIIFDVNGEYSQALESGLPEGIYVKRLELDGTAGDGKFTLPHWLLNLEEWELLLRASERAQQPVLRNALAVSSLFSSSKKIDIKQHYIARCILEIFSSPEGAAGQGNRISALLQQHGEGELEYSLLGKYSFNHQFGNFTPSDKYDDFTAKVREFLIEDVDIPPYKNQPFPYSEMVSYLDFAILYEEAHGNRQIRDYCSSLITRLHSISNREDFAFLRDENKNSSDNTKENKLREILGLSGEQKENQIIILDMNGVGDEVVELVSAVLARMIFDLLRKQPQKNRNQFPVNLVLEEAHRYIAQRPSQYAIDASHIFERIAKEGRKYGMFLTVASQRPSELSTTVLSQCSNFVVHRIQNPDDLAHIRQMTPYISGNVLSRLPSLPKQHALIFGNSVNIPTTFKVREAAPKPKSDDAKIRDLWFNGPPDVKLEF